MPIDEEIKRLKMSEQTFLTICDSVVNPCPPCCYSLYTECSGEAGCAPLEEQLNWFLELRDDILDKRVGGIKL